jgi:hypothetical protein
MIPITMILGDNNREIHKYNIFQCLYMFPKRKTEAINFSSQFYISHHNFCKANINQPSCNQRIFRIRDQIQNSIWKN